MRDIWQETVQTDSAERIGVTMLLVELCQVHDLLDVLVEVTLSIVNTRYAPLDGPLWVTNFLTAFIATHARAFW